MRKAILIFVANISLCTPAFADGGQLTGGGLTKVIHDGTLSGNGTGSSPLVVSAAGSYGTGTTSTTAKWVSSTALGNAWPTDDGTTWGVTSKFTITEASGNFRTFGTGTVDGTLVASTKFQVGSTSVPATAIFYVEDDSTTDTTAAWFVTQGTNHVGTGGNNEQIPIVIRNTTDFDTRAIAAHATGIDLAVTGGIATGSNSMESIGIAIAGHCSTGNCATYSIKSGDDAAIFQNNGPVVFGGGTGSSPVTLGSGVQNFRVIPVTPTGTVPQIDIGGSPGTDGYNLHIQNTATGVNGMGIGIAGNTTTAPLIAPQIAFYRNASGSMSGDFGLLCVDNGGSCNSGGSANDFVLANYFTGRDLYLQAKGSVILGTTTVPTLTMTSGHVATFGGPVFISGGGNYLSVADEVGAFSGGTILLNGSISFANLTNGAATGKINAVGYLESTSQFRNLEIDDGKGAAVATFTASTKAAILAGNATVGAGAQVLSGGAPSANHGSLSTSSTDWSGDITSIGANSAVILTYSTAAPNRSRCTATPNNHAVAAEIIEVAAAAATATFSCYSVTTVPVLTNCDDFTYNCVLQ